MQISKKIILAATVSCIYASAGAVNTLAVGGSHSVALRADGKVFSWGDNRNGNLGDGSSSHSRVPKVAKFFNEAKSISAGNSHTLIAKNDGTVWSWGYNGYGQLGTGDTSTFYLPTQVQYLSNVNFVAAGCNFSLALKSDGTVWAWGSNNYGALGIPGGNKSAPIQISSLNGVTAIAAGCASGYALRADGTVWSWGDNSYGQLGNGTTTATSTPVQIPGITDVAMIAAGDSHAIALKRVGAIVTWGANDYCQLGRSINQYSQCASASAPGVVSAISGVTQIAGYYRNTAVLKEDGTVWVFGSNEYGQLGSGATVGYRTASITPVQATGLTNISEIGSGRGDHLLARKTTGEVYSWGANEYGQLGNGEANSNSANYNSAVPVQVLGPGGDGYLNLVALPCQGTVSETTGLALNIPCVAYHGAQYQVKFLLDPAITSGTYFKLIDMR